jgi:hypothetical protein
VVFLLGCVVKSSSGGLLVVFWWSLPLPLGFAIWSLGEPRRGKVRFSDCEASQGRSSRAPWRQLGRQAVIEYKALHQFASAMVRERAPSARQTR